MEQFGTGTTARGSTSAELGERSLYHTIYSHYWTLYLLLHKNSNTTPNGGTGVEFI